MKKNCLITFMWLCLFWHVSVIYYMNENNIYNRNCPNCNKIIIYKRFYDHKYAEENKSICKKCVIQKRSNDPDYIAKFSGSNNHFYGKHHTEKTKELIGLKRRGIKLTGKALEYSRRTIKIAIAARGNKTFYEIWVIKYGKKIADEKLAKYKSLLSVKNSGKGNPMYGKPTPQGSGNGWACWYKNIHFRSIRELIFYIKEIENKNLICRTAQTGDLRIPYIDINGNDRTYTADFLVEEKYLIEIKPKPLWKSKEVKIKAYAAIRFCRKNGLIYKIKDIEPDSIFLKEKYLNGEIKFVDKYRERFEKFIGIV